MKPNESVTVTRIVPVEAAAVADATTLRSDRPISMPLSELVPGSPPARPRRPPAASSPEAPERLENSRLEEAFFRAGQQLDPTIPTELDYEFYVDPRLAHAREPDVVARREHLRYAVGSFLALAIVVSTLPLTKRFLWSGPERADASERDVPAALGAPMQSRNGAGTLTAATTANATAAIPTGVATETTPPEAPPAPAASVHPSADPHAGADRPNGKIRSATTAERSQHARDVADATRTEPTTPSVRRAPPRRHSKKDDFSTTPMPSVDIYDE